MGNCWPKHIDSSPIPVKNDIDSEATSRKNVSQDLKIFTWEELKAATRNFRPETVLSESTYKGWVDEATYAPSNKVGVGIPVVVKRFEPDTHQGLEEVQAEVDILGKISHPNIAKLIGYCWKDKFLVLVYEYIPNGSLDNHLFRPHAKLIPWDLRLRIATDVARALAFLHTMENQLIRRPFQASNILLDMDYNAKVSDFGFAKLDPAMVPTKLTLYGYGSPPYMATEEMTTGHLNKERDVYGFGAVLLELLTGRRLLDRMRPFREHNSIDWATPALPYKRKLSTIMDPHLLGQYPSKAAFRTAGLIRQCIGPDPETRPNMKLVLEVLEQIRIQED